MKEVSHIVQSHVACICIVYILKTVIYVSIYTALMSSNYGETAVKSCYLQFSIQRHLDVHECWCWGCSTYILIASRLVPWDNQSSTATGHLVIQLRHMYSWCLVYHTTQTCKSRLFWCRCITWCCWKAEGIALKMLNSFHHEIQISSADFLFARLIATTKAFSHLKD